MLTKEFASSTRSLQKHTDESAIFGVSFAKVTGDADSLSESAQKLTGKSTSSIESLPTSTEDSAIFTTCTQGFSKDALILSESFPPLSDLVLNLRGFWLRLWRSNQERRVEMKALSAWLRRQ